MVKKYPKGWLTKKYGLAIKSGLVKGDGMNRMNGMNGTKGTDNCFLSLRYITKYEMY